MIAISAQAFPPASGGIENLMLGLAQHAAEQGEAVRVLADAKPGDRDFDRLWRGSVEIDRFGGPRPLRRWRKARALLRLGGVETVFADSWKSLEALSGGLPARVVVFAHGNEYPADGRKRARIRRALGRADLVLAVSRETQGRLERFRPEGLPVELCHPPVQPPAEPSAQDLSWAAERWNGASPRLLCLCRLVDWKGVDQALRALAALGRGSLVIAGEGPDRPRLEALAGELGIADRVRFVGRVEGGRKTALLREAEIFLQPGRRVAAEREGFGITYLEAALAGLPSICGREGGAPEAVLDGRTGLVVDGADAEAVTAALRRLADDPALRARMSEAARRHGEAALWPRRIGAILAHGARKERGRPARPSEHAGLAAS